MGKGRTWTTREKKWLEIVYGYRTLKEIAAALRRTENAVYQQACKQGIQKTEFEEPDWSAMRKMIEELAITHPADGGKSDELAST